MLLWPLFIMIRLRFTDHSPGKYYYLHHDSAKTRAQNCHLGFPSCHLLTHRTDIELVFFFYLFDWDMTYSHIPSDGCFLFLFDLLDMAMPNVVVFFYFIEVQLIYSVVLISGVQQSNSVIHTHTHTHTHTHCFSYSFPLWFISAYWI